MDQGGCEVSGAAPPTDGAGPVVLEARAGARWSGLCTLEPGSRLRLAGPSHFRLTYGRAVRAAPRQVLLENSVQGCESFSEWFEVSCEPSRSKKQVAESAVVPGDGETPFELRNHPWNQQP